MKVDLSTVKKEEERKREAAYDPVQRWKHIQQTVTWAEANCLVTCSATGHVCQNGWARNQDEYP